MISLSPPYWFAFIFAGTAFKCGDQVRLQYGGPVMTVERVRGVRVWCVWFEDDRILQRAEFQAAALRQAY